MGELSSKSSKFLEIIITSTPAAWEGWKPSPFPICSFFPLFFGGGDIRYDLCCLDSVMGVQYGYVSKC